MFDKNAYSQYSKLNTNEKSLFVHNVLLRSYKKYLVCNVLSYNLLEPSIKVTEIILLGTSSFSGFLRVTHVGS